MRTQLSLSRSSKYILCDWYHLCEFDLKNRAVMMNDPELDCSAAVNPNPLYSLHPSTEGFRLLSELLLRCL